ncbi:MAG: sortase [Wenzhouxiangellaceae bacterium]
MIIRILMLAALAHLAWFGWVQGKGTLGQWLMESAWAEADRRPAEAPWPGARTRPAARMYVPELAIDRLVVEGLETANLAWGPGIARGRNGHTVIAAHRDTHFRFLGQLQADHRIELEHPAGVVENWRVEDTRIVDSRTTELDLDATGPLLTLVTCWPIDALEAGGPLRLVVSAVPAEGESS